MQAMSIVVLSCPENTILLWSSWSSGSCLCVAKRNFWVCSQPFMAILATLLLLWEKWLKGWKVYLDSWFEKKTHYHEGEAMAVEVWGDLSPCICSHKAGTNPGALLAVPLSSSYSIWDTQPIWLRSLHTMWGRTFWGKLSWNLLHGHAQSLSSEGF